MYTFPQIFAPLNLIMKHLLGSCLRLRVRVRLRMPRCCKVTELKNEIDRTVKSELYISCNLFFPILKLNVS